MMVVMTPEATPAQIDAVVERILQDTRYGNAWAAQLGLAVPFEY